MRPAVSLSVLLIVFIAFACAVLVLVAGLFLFKRVVLGRRATSGDEKNAMRIALQRALGYCRRMEAVRRAQAGEASRPKPVKPNVDDFEKLVLNESNMSELAAYSNTHTTATAATVAAATADMDILDHARALVRSNTQPLYHPLQETVHSQESCSVCIEVFKIGETVRIIPSCKHVFHATCVDPWLSNISSLCPLCKTDTRTPQEIEDYNTRLAAAIASEDDPSIALAVNSVPFNGAVMERFDETVDNVCMETLGRVISRTCPMRITASYENTNGNVVDFKTRVFIRDIDELSSAGNDIGWWARKVHNYRLKHHTQENVHILLPNSDSVLPGNYLSAFGPNPYN